MSIQASNGSESTRRRLTEKQVETVERLTTAAGGMGHLSYEQVADRLETCALRILA
ncbi:hypothetical protein OG874_16075 [Nocardia sp. NBC_00565]|uniref:hypothetical protein n=1 Tax=Nocardia sp. NBC_00565 TaxID=2975993 RepID=UPI002E81DF5F|nr:hypothetical protein [Nocardia sp. NBC_00565]WUC06545.1 hypothetical protein OG874_16075 [Nocardia sp. NBC_00565]